MKIEIEVQRTLSFWVDQEFASQAECEAYVNRIRNAYKKKIEHGEELTVSILTVKI